MGSESDSAELAGSRGVAYAAPGDGIRALVCGFAPPIQQTRILAMLQAFVDDSGSESSEKGGRVFVLAGLLSTAESWGRFSAEWAAICDKDPKTPDFHMTDAERIKGGYWGSTTEPESMLRDRRDARVRKLASVVRQHAILSVACSLTWRAYEAATSGQELPKSAAPYFFLFWRFIQLIARWQFKTGRHEKVDFIFDDQGAVGIEAVSWHPFFLEAMNEDEKFILSCTPNFQHDLNVLPLKAADFWAWHYRREIVERVRHANGRKPYPRRRTMEVLWTIPRAETIVTEDSIRRMIAAIPRATL